jgi:hypothetical protein
MRSVKLPRLLLCAWSIYLIAWGVPVVEGGATLPEGLPGWQAFWFALSPLWEDSDQPWYGAVLQVSSGLTNLAMIASPLILLPRVRRWAAAAAWTGMASGVLNAVWLSFGTDLRAGYFLWWTSFLLMGIGAFQVVRTARPKSHAD